MIHSGCWFPSFLQKKGEISLFLIAFKGLHGHSDCLNYGFTGTRKLIPPKIGWCNFDIMKNFIRTYNGKNIGLQKAKGLKTC